MGSRYLLHCTALGVPRAPGCCHGGPGVLGTTNTLPRIRVKKEQTHLCVPPVSSPGFSPSPLGSPGAAVMATVPPSQPSANAPAPGITLGWPRGRGCRFRCCPTRVLLFPAQPREAPHAPGTLQPLHRAPAQDWHSEMMCASLRVQLINNIKVLIIPLVPVFHKSSCCLMRSYEQALSSLSLL